MRSSDGKRFKRIRKICLSILFQKKASGDMTVSQWKQNRFYPYYPGLEVDVLDVVGIAVSGQDKA